MSNKTLLRVSLACVFAAGFMSGLAFNAYLLSKSLNVNATTDIAALSGVAILFLLWAWLAGKEN